MNTLALYAQSQAQAPSSENTAVAENNVGATAQSSNLGDSSSSSTSSTTNTSGTSGTPTTTTSTETSAVDTFLTLFVAEIENQDPTDPKLHKRKTTDEDEQYVFYNTHEPINAKCPARLR